MTFQYTAFDIGGVLHAGVLDAASLSDAEAMVLEKWPGYVELRPKREKAAKGKRRQAAIFEKVSPVEVAFFLRQMGNVLQVGIPLPKALTMQEDSARTQKMAAAIRGIRDHVMAGGAMYEALYQYPAIFPRMAVHMIHAAELTGHLDEAFFRAATYVLSTWSTFSSIKRAMTYPAVVFALLIGASLFMVYKVFPVLGGMYSAFGVKLPELTVLMIAFTNWGTRWLPVVLIALAAAVWGLVYYTNHNRQAKIMRDRLLLRLPVLKLILYDSALVRFLRTYASLQEAGMPLAQTLDLSIEASSNAYFIAQLLLVKDEIVSGQGIARPLERTTLFPSLVTTALAIGEEAGQVASSMEALITYYEEELTTAIQGLQKTLEPLLTGIVAVGVALLMAATLLPMYQIMSEIKIH